MKIAVDRERCICSGNCVALLNEVFDQDETGVVILRQTMPDARLADAVREVATLCPAAAIEVTE